MSGNFIDDGYTETRTIDPVAGLYDGLTITFRPMDSSDIAAWLHDIGEKDDTAARRVTSKWIADHITKWSEERKCTAENLLKLRPPVWDRLWAIIRGVDGGDSEGDQKNLQTG